MAIALALEEGRCSGGQEVDGVDAPLGSEPLRMGNECSPKTAATFRSRDGQRTQQGSLAVQLQPDDAA